MSARLGLPRAVVGGARWVAQRLVAWMAFGKQALLSPEVMRPCRVASDGLLFSSVIGLPLSLSSCRAVIVFAPWAFSRFLGYSHAASSDAAHLDRRVVTCHTETLACVSFSFRSRRLFWDLAGGLLGRPGIRRPGRHARPLVEKRKEKNEFAKNKLKHVET